MPTAGLKMARKGTVAKAERSGAPQSGDFESTLLVRTKRLNWRHPGPQAMKSSSLPRVVRFPYTLQVTIVRENTT